MCRAGGRRCPSHSDPVAMAARNARRRATYAAKKNKETQFENYNSEQKSVIQDDNNTTFENYPTLKVNATPETNYDNVYDQLIADNQDKLSNSSPMIIPDQLKPKSNRLSDNLDRLDNNFLEEYGFTEIKDGKWSFNSSEDYHLKQALKDSKIDTADFTRNEKRAVTLFTGADYTWINKELYNPDREKFDAEREESRKTQKFDADTYFDENSKSIWGNGVSPNERNTSSQDLERIVSYLDSAIEYGDLERKTVYRGVKLPDFVSNPEEMDKWLDERAVGSEITFDGYTSTSTNPSVALGFGLHEKTDTEGTTAGVIYQISTPEGIHIASISEMEEECEVLLPRNQRYMVVGVQKNVELDDNEGWYKGRKTNIIQLIAINNDGEILDHTNGDKRKPVYPDSE